MTPRNERNSDMKRLVPVLTLSLALFGGGCAQLQTLTGDLSLVTKSIANPVTPADEVAVEVALGGARDLLEVYKNACIAGSADVNCKANIAQIQVYTRQIKPLVAQLRTFVDTNDQINAAAVYNSLKALYTTVKSTATQLGVNLGSATI
jgi:hypothetical protein